MQREIIEFKTDGLFVEANKYLAMSMGQHNFKRNLKFSSPRRKFICVINLHPDDKMILETTFGAIIYNDIQLN